MVAVDREMVLLSLSSYSTEEKASVERHVVIRMRKVETSTAGGGYTFSNEAAIVWIVVDLHELEPVT